MICGNFANSRIADLKGNEVTKKECLERRKTSVPVVVLAAVRITSYLVPWLKNAKGVL